MADTHETVADIIRKIRAEADSIEESARGSLKAGENYDGIAFTESDLESALDLADTKRKEADRLDAALKREKAAIEADALAVGGIVGASRATAENPSAVGDCAKLREALKATLDLLWDIHNANRSPQSNQAYAVIRQIKAALAAPPRNCDVGTAEEQTKRKFEFCQKQGGCGNCSLNRGPSITPCVLAWAQMPYEEGGAK